MTIVHNATTLKLVEVTFATKGSQRNSVTRELPIACFDVRDGVAYPVTIVPRVAGAHYFTTDNGKRWWGEDGTEHTSWATLLDPLYAEDARRNAKAPEPALTEPAIGEVDHWGTGQEPQRPKPPHRQAQRVYPR